eukprot:933751-Prorocentrum_lima.AAC.1
MQRQRGPPRVQGQLPERTKVDNAVSPQHPFRFQPESVEKLGRGLFTIGNADSVQIRDLLSDGWYSKHDLRVEH